MASSKTTWGSSGLRNITRVRLAVWKRMHTLMEPRQAGSPR